MSYLVVYLIGVVFGGLAVKLLTIQKRSGNIIVTKDEDGTYFSLSLKSLSDITNKKEVTLGVISQK